MVLRGSDPLLLINSFFQIDTRGEFRNPARIDFNNRASLRVTTVTGLALVRGKSTKTRESHSISLFQGRTNTFDNRLDGMSCLRLADPRIGSDFLN